MPAAIDHCSPDLAPHLGIRHQAAPGKSNDFVEITPQRDPNPMTGTIERASNAAYPDEVAFWSIDLGDQLARIRQHGAAQRPGGAHAPARRSRGGDGRG